MQAQVVGHQNPQSYVTDTEEPMTILQLRFPRESTAFNKRLSRGR